MKFLLILLLILIWFLLDCTHTPVFGIYNHEHEQDWSCYGKYGGQFGYCDKGGR